MKATAELIVRNARVTCARVWDGAMTASTYPRSAAMYGLASVSSYSVMYRARSATGSSASLRSWR